MASAVVAVFGEYSEAQGAVNELLLKGFDQDHIKLSGDEQGAAPRGEKGRGVGDFFRSLFGREERRDEAGTYAEAVRHGNYVLTAIAPSEEKVAVASEVLSHHHPIDLEREASGWVDQAQPERVATPSERTVSTAEGRAIPVVEEELEIGKRKVQRGGVRVFQRVSEQPVSQDVELREEKVTVERRPVNTSVGAAPGAFKEESFEVRETAEEPVVTKTAHVVEEVRVGKQVNTRKETVQDTVRKTQVEVEDLGDEGSYRNHWEQTHGSEGGRYEDFRPAYRYGAEIGDDQRFRDRGWSEIEPDIRPDWEAKNPGSAWERFKGSVRHAFEAMKGKSRRED